YCVVETKRARRMTGGPVWQCNVKLLLLAQLHACHLCSVHSERDLAPFLGLAEDVAGGDFGLGSVLAFPLDLEVSRGLVVLVLVVHLQGQSAFGELDEQALHLLGEDRPGRDCKGNEGSSELPDHVCLLLDVRVSPRHRARRGPRPDRGPRAELRGDSAAMASRWRHGIINPPPGKKYRPDMGFRARTNLRMSPCRLRAGSALAFLH